MRTLVLLAMVLVLVASSAAQPSDFEEPIGPRMEDGAFGNEAAVPDDNPRIDPDEVVAPSIDSRDPAWVAPYREHSGETGDGKGAASLACDGRANCEAYKANATRSSSTSTTGALR